MNRQKLYAELLGSYAEEIAALAKEMETCRGETADRDFEAVEKNIKEMKECLDKWDSAEYKEAELNNAEREGV